MIEKMGACTVWCSEFGIAHDFSYQGLFIFYPQIPIENHLCMLVGSFQALWELITKTTDFVFCISWSLGPRESLRS
jgi:hypothetical protein